MKVDVRETGLKDARTKAGAILDNVEVLDGMDRERKGGASGSKMLKKSLSWW